jgi:hypothetical protein
MSRGWVYVLDNPSMPGKVKIGFTERIPDMRASELDATGVPTPFVIQFTALVDRAFELEQAVHTSMDVNRVRQNREWFNLTVDEAIEAIKTSAIDMSLELLFEDDRFSDDKRSTDKIASTKLFARFILENKLDRALGVLESVLAVSTDNPSWSFYDLAVDFEELFDRENDPSPSKILAQNPLLEAQIFNLLFKKYIPKTSTLRERILSIKLFWNLFPKKLADIDQLLEECCNELYSYKLTSDNWWVTGTLASKLVERNMVSKAIEVIQYSAPFIRQIKYTTYPVLAGIVNPLGAILSTSGASEELDAIISKLLPVPLFVNCLVKNGFPKKYECTGNISERIPSLADLEMAKDFLTSLGNKNEWRFLSVTID